MQMKKAFGAVAVIFSLLMGAVGFYLRRLQLETSFEPGTGLAVRGSRFSSAVLIFLAAAFVFTLLLSLAPGLKRALPTSPKNALRCGPLASAAAVLCGFCALSAGVFLFLSSRSWELPLLYTVLAGLTLLSCLQAPTAAFRLRASETDSLAGFAFTAPLVTCLFWLVLYYRNNAGNPVLWTYAISVLAISAFTLAHYYLAGYVFGKPAPLRSLFFTVLSAILGITSLADTGYRGMGVLTVYNVVTMLFFTGVIARNAFFEE